jgi:hypothetical protein
MSDKRYKTKICEQCGDPWKTRTLTARTCSMRCAALLREKEYPSQGKKREYPPEIIERIGELHASGMSRGEITRIIGPGVSVQTVIGRYFPRRRERGKIPVTSRHQLDQRYSGENSHRWKGDDASYTSFHFRVERVRGKPEYCACCDIVGPGFYEWANLTGNYADVDDYVRLCVSHHRHFDLYRRKILGQNTSMERKK